MANVRPDADDEFYCLYDNFGVVDDSIRSHGTIFWYLVLVLFKRILNCVQSKLLKYIWRIFKL